MGTPYKEKRKLLTDFYIWMVENEFDHNIRIRVENKAELFLRECEGKNVNTEERQLTISDVSSRRELLIDFCKYVNKECCNLSQEWYEGHIDDFFKSNL